ncbi:hypothetical protein, partial [Nostoc piscinale]|uniref:hypothetical protein n=1 Tax=Nostoc piscinale TaxID=224012 RepID=UPI0039A488DA
VGGGVEMYLIQPRTAIEAIPTTKAVRLIDIVLDFKYFFIPVFVLNKNHCVKGYSDVCIG